MQGLQMRKWWSWNQSWNPMATVELCSAFGMEVHVDMQTVIHYRTTADIDGYFQGSGRAKRDGIESNAILYCYPGCLIHHVGNSTANQKPSAIEEVLEHFIGSLNTSVKGGTKHNSCDICTYLCLYWQVPITIGSLWHEYWWWRIWWGGGTCLKGNWNKIPSTKASFERGQNESPSVCSKALWRTTCVCLPWYCVWTFYQHDWHSNWQLWISFRFIWCRW